MNWQDIKLYLLAAVATNTKEERDQWDYIVDKLINNPEVIFQSTAAYCDDLKGKNINHFFSGVLHGIALAAKHKHESVKGKDLH
jgi:hypothetical protein